MNKSQALKQLSQAESSATVLTPLTSCNLLPCVDNSQLHQCEQWCSKGLEDHRLMLRAGVSCANWIADNFDKEMKIEILCGGGNNGGDGLVCAAGLVQYGYKVGVTLLAEPSTFDSKWAFKLALAVGTKCKDYSGDLTRADLYVDAMIGRGGKGELRAPLDMLVDKLNLCNKPIVSIDVPTGKGGSRQCQAMNTLMMLSIDPQIGTVKGGNLIVDKHIMQSGLFCDLGAIGQLRSFPQILWLELLYSPL